MSKGEIKDRYTAVAVGHNINPGDDNKAPTVEVEMRGLDHQAGKQFWLYLSLKEGQAQEITAKTLRTLGWKCNDITKLEGLGSVKVQIIEKEELYKGKPQRRYDVWEIKERASLREDEANGFAAKFKALAASVKPTSVTELNAAPAELPEVRAKNGTAAPGGVTSGGGDANPSDLYA